MSSFNLEKKLLPAKKAWKSFTQKLQAKLQKLNLSTTASKTTRGCRKPALCSSHSAIILRSLTRHHRSPPACHRHHYVRKTMPAIYVDELFARGVDNPSHNPETKTHQDDGKSSSGSKQMGATSCNKGEGEKFRKSPQWRGIDERAEEFISKFREDMKLQRKKSIDDFHEMLARSC